MTNSLVPNDVTVQPNLLHHSFNDDVVSVRSSSSIAATTNSQAQNEEIGEMTKNIINTEITVSTNNMNDTDNMNNTNNTDNANNVSLANNTDSMNNMSKEISMESKQHDQNGHSAEESTSTINLTAVADREQCAPAEGVANNQAAQPSLDPRVTTYLSKVQNIRQSKRNGELHKLGLRLRGTFGLAGEALEAALLEVNGAKCSPPLSESEVQAICHSVDKSKKVPLGKPGATRNPRAKRGGSAPKYQIREKS